MKNKIEKNARKNQSVKEIAICGLFAALAMIFSYAETLIPIPFPVPGMRLGFANIAIITALYTYSFKNACIVNIVRIVLTSLLFGNINSFFFSIAGGIASLIIMALIKKIDKFSLLAVSALGGVVHNLAQLSIVGVVLGSYKLIYLSPIFMIMGIVTGLICGLISRIFLKHIKKLT